MSPRMFCTYCGGSFGRTSVCPGCGAESRYWDLDEPRVFVWDESSAAPEPPTSECGEGWVAAAACLSLSSVLEVGADSTDRAVRPVDDRPLRCRTTRVLPRVGEAQQPPVAGYLVRVSAPPGGKAHTLKEGRNTLGRSESCDVVIPDPSVSNLHASLSCTRLGDKVSWTIRDLGSRNGTYVDGNRVAEAQVGLGSVLSISTVEFRLQGDPGTAEVPIGTDVHAAAEASPPG